MKKVPKILKGFSHYKCLNWKEYWDNGRIWKKGGYKDGKKHGLWETYSKEGELFEQVNYKDGIKDGLLEKHWGKMGNGRLMEKGNFKKVI